MWETKGSPQLSADRLGSQQSREESRAEADLRDIFPWRFQGLHLGGAKKGVGEPFTGLGKIISLKLEDVWRDTAPPVREDLASRPGIWNQRWVYPLFNSPDISSWLFLMVWWMQRSPFAPQSPGLQDHLWEEV